MQHQNVKIVIADDNEDFTEILSEYLSSQSGFEIVGIAENGLVAMELIKEKEPDIAILDIIMPHLDGLGVLERIHASNMRKNPIIIILSALGQDKITNLAINLGASFFMVKPFDMDVLVSRIRQLQSMDDQEDPQVTTVIDSPPAHRSTMEESLDLKISRILHDVGIPAHLKGFQYLKEAILMVIEDISMINTVTKRLYPSVASKFKTVPINVERAMRNTIAIALSRGMHETMGDLLGYEISPDSSKVTNSEFIARVAEKVRLE
jgi:two-component system, response regulator, stage 0 sporulation protein A